MHVKMLSLAALLGAILALPATVNAKGPSEARITGAGIDGPIVLKGSGEAAGTRLFRFTQDSGFFPAMFGQTPDPMLRKRPAGDLGPRYAVLWKVPGPSGEDTIKADLYPYAEGGPLTFTRAGQRFFGTESTYGGWFRAASGLRTTLVASGLPRSEPAGPSAGVFGDTLWKLLAAGAALLALLAATAAVTRRRLRALPAR